MSDSEQWKEIPLFAPTEDDLKDVRTHIFKFSSKNEINFDKFQRPVYMSRKDPRNISFHLSRKEQEQRKKERQEEEARKKEEIEREKAQQDQEDQSKPKAQTPDAEQSKIAPDGGARRGKKSLFKRKTKQINLMDDAKRKLRYEEHFPWILEDYTGDNVFTSSYEAPSNEQALFVFDKNGFKLIPVEKSYRFAPRNRYATLTIEEAEAKMSESNIPRWLMKHMEEDSIQEGIPDQRFKKSFRTASNNMRTVTGGAVNERDSDHDDLDFEEEFADDEEAPIMDGDEEENKLSERKVKKEMLKAAHFNAEEEADDDLDDLFETEKSRKVDKEGKKLRKVLNKREGGIYDSDEDEQEGQQYLSKSDLESDEESESEIKVKTEPGEDEPLQPQQYQRTISAKDIGDGFVLVKAPKEFLETLPFGDWLPNGRKPDLSAPFKRIKLEKTPSKERSPSPAPVVNTAITEDDLNNPGPDSLLVTVKDVLDIVRDRPLTTKELLVGLKSRVSAHPDNKQRIIAIVKQNLKLVDGKLVLKE
ncbi:TFG1 [Candida pseudojiufengensis]|uniref:TFG1 n=1 Tax=Candida pseudojiufengensis TaxID=497109 RepID=UPI0022249B82|nr:TFG1 [Candida pseudojiufengensis]KAI5965767.1 TFG1 [Candida pseudojiufengensis]